MATKPIEITKVGPMSYRQLQSLNNPDSRLEDVFSPEEIASFGLDYSPTLASPYEDSPQLVQSGLGNWGDSMWDKKSASDEEFNRLQDIRANNQPGIAKLGAGIGKGIALAGTTFVDGTLGLVYGLSQVPKNGISALWDNDVSNALQSINDAMEEILPNYRTEAEANSPWYENLGTMNFWADSFIKNLGFTVGAYYSGAAWTKGLKALGVLTKALPTEIAGSTLSAINEGRIEANNNVSDWKDLQIAQLKDEYQKARAELLPDNAMYEVNLALLEDSYKKREQEINERADAMGAGILLANSVLLSYTNFKTFGKLYGQGFRNARSVSRDNIKRAAKDEANALFERQAATELGENATKTAGKWAWNEITTKRAIANGLRTGAREGLEEMNQALISEAAGYTQTPDSPEAYYRALLDPDADIETSDILSAITKGFVNTYGNAERWEEGVVGALTGLLGMPTVGRVRNSGPNTYLGRDKWIGLSGGFFGELTNANYQNEQGKSAVDIMNNYEEKLLQQKTHFAQSQSFINAMDGWAAQNNAFEYKNAEDNDDFAAIDAYAKLGKLDYLKGLVKHDFENFSDEDLTRIATYTSQGSEDVTEPRYDGWRASDGSLLSESEEGREQMRGQLIEKRDKILKEIDAYENSLGIVRGISYQSKNMTDSQVEELAWMHWKIGKFSDRFKELRDENKAQIASMISGMNDWKSALEEEALNLEGDETIQKENKNMLNNINLMIDFLEKVQSENITSTGLLGLSKWIKDVPEFMQMLSDKSSYDMFADKSNMDYAAFENLMNNLSDLGKLSTAYDNFNEKFKEFSDNPEKMLTAREKIKKKVESTAKKKQFDKLAEKMTDNFQSGLDDLENQGIDRRTAADEFAKQGYEELADKLNSLEDKSILKNNLLSILGRRGMDAQTMSDVTTLLNLAEQSGGDLLDMEMEVYQNPYQLFKEDDQSLMGLSNEAIRTLLTERLEKAKTLINDAKQEWDKMSRSTEGLAQEVSSEEAAPTTETGHDPVEHVDGPTIGDSKVPNHQNKLLEHLIALDEGVDEATQKNIQEVASTIDFLTQSTKNSKDLLKVLRGSVPYQKVVSKFGSATLDAAVEQYCEELYAAEEPLTPANATNVGPTEAEIQENNSEFIEEATPGQKLYWTNGQSKFPIHGARVSGYTPFYQLAGNAGYQNYSEEELKAIRAVGKYFEEHKVWDRIDSGLVGSKTELYFSVDPTLNEEAGQFVILLTDKSGNVVGNLPMKWEKNFDSYQYLDKLYEKVEKSYQETVKDDDKGMFTFKGASTHVAKWMIGQPRYTSDVEFDDEGKPINSPSMNSLRRIFTVKSSDGASDRRVPFQLGIWAKSPEGIMRLVTDSGTKSSQKENPSPLRPASVKNGQPFVLISTGNNSGVREKLCVPVRTLTLREVASGSPIIGFVSGLMDQFPKFGWRQIKSNLEALFAARFSVNEFSGTEGTTLVIKKKNPDGHWEQIYKGPKADATSSVLFTAVSDLHFNVSLSHINKGFNGVDYNELMADVLETNLEVGAIHTESNWFTINPLDDNLKEIKAKSPKSVGVTPVTDNTKAFEYKGHLVTIDTTTWDAVSIDGKEYKQGTANTNLALAYCWGLHTNQDMSKPYDTNWGYYNPKTNSFEEKPQRTLTPDQVTAMVKGIEGFAFSEEEGPSNKPLASILKNSGCLVQSLNKKAADALKSLPEYQTLEGMVQTTPKIIVKQIWDKVVQTYDPVSDSFDITQLDNVIENAKTLYREVSSEHIEKWDEATEVNWLSKALPQLSAQDSLRIVRGCDKLSVGTSSGRAWGQFKQGVITIAEGAAKGTLYHEAFHAVTQTLLDDAELDTLYSEAAKTYGKVPRITLEENLAEEFRKYVQYEQEPIIGGIVKIFRTLKHIVQNLFGKENYIDNLFYKINRNKLANRSPKLSRTNVALLRQAVSDEIYDLENEIDLIGKAIEANKDAFRAQLKTMETLIGYKFSSFASMFSSEVENWTKENGIDMVTSVFADGANGYRARYNGLKTDTYIKALSDSLHYEEKKQNLEYLKKHRADIEMQEASDELLGIDSSIHQYYSKRLSVDSLTDAQKQFLKAKGISLTEYSKMSLAEKEQLYHCA